MDVMESIRKDYPKALIGNENRSKMKAILLSLGTEAVLLGDPPPTTTRHDVC